ncbi:MAG: virulence protein [Bacilli bacterium]|nr:virulence protein [Bacilli bacterium]
MDDRELVVAFGKNRSDTSWKNEYLTWAEFVKNLGFRRTDETMAEYDRMTKDQKGAIKDGHAYVGGQIRGGRRKKESVELRDIITLDVDHADEHFIFAVELMIGGMAYVFYSTHSHRPGKPKYRLVIPVSRSMTPDEHAAVARKLALWIGIHQFDHTTFDVNRLMYLPSCSKDATPVMEVSEGKPMDVDAVLAAYATEGKDWRDPLDLPRHPEEKKPLENSGKKLADPREKPSIIGAFCRQYDISTAIDKFLSGVYEPTAVPNRYTYIGGTSFGGLIIYDDYGGDTFAYSCHESDPISGREVNAFDLVRIHLFGDITEAEIEKKTPSNRLQSYKEMCAMAAEDDLTKIDLINSRMEQVREDFGEMNLDEKPEDSEFWKAALQINPKTRQIISNSWNAEVIIRKDPAFKGLLAFDDFGNQEVFKGDLPWRKALDADKYEAWLGADDKRLRHYLGKYYGIKSPGMIQDAFAEIVHKNKFHPIKTYLHLQVWDGQPRLETLFIDYLGADDTPYVRAVTRKAFTAAVRRVMEPGCKFDHMLVLVGEQGVGKSTIIHKMGREWFSDSLKTLDGKTAYEQLQGAWILEIGELSALKKSEVEEIKHFVTKRDDRYRVAYDRQVSDFPRKCVFFGTTNNYTFLQDATGNRRFWPVDVNKVNRRLDVMDLNDELIGLIWAEAVESWEKGESLYLDPELEKQAVKHQDDHFDENPQSGLVQEYLDRLLPENWEDLEVYSRRYYIVGDDLAPRQEGVKRRDRVCAMEIWVECFGKNQADLKPHEARAINDMLRRIPGWQPYGHGTGRIRFKHYALQTAFIRAETQRVI